MFVFTSVHDAHEQPHRILLQTIAHLEQWQIHGYQNNTYYQPQENNDERFHHAA